jgi:hypothetical protein
MHFGLGLERYRTVYMGMRSSRVVYRAIWLQMQQSWVQFQHPPPRGYGVHDATRVEGVDRVNGGGQMGVDPDPQQTGPKIQS